ncbi:38368_t:CDS:1 [Gigaspora margarita]|uniref:38368_t:CDS:1 n=1 Tax=Gigaspora margarita TaxID=4874 RepID=A0ABN7VUB3_GIGMA|nr:38368_t:CDS:1 [Gigaspora margarita]
MILASINKILADECNGWRITSPIVEGLVWTAGQYYDISWEPSNSQVETVDIVDLYTDNNELAATQWKGPISVKTLTTGNFQLRVSSTGTYYLNVTATTSSGGKCSLNSVSFTVITGLPEPSSSDTSTFPAPTSSLAPTSSPTLRDP